MRILFNFISLMLIMIFQNFDLISKNSDEIFINTNDRKNQKNMHELDPNSYNINPNGSLDGKFSVTSTNLNATYSIPITSENYNGSVLDFSLFYNGGIEHKAILGMNPNIDGFGYKTYSKKLPLWYLSVNNFVVQAFSYNRTILSDPHMYSRSRYDGGYNKTVNGTQKYVFSNKDLNFSIKGYHFNNLIEPFEPHPLNTSYPNFNIHDKIHILRADGSLLTLVNEEFDTDISTRYQSRTGRYLEYGPNTNGYAIVDELDEESFTCDLIDDYENIRRRRVRYYPGDGMEYVFIEYISPYGIELLQGLPPHISNANLIIGDDPLTTKLLFQNINGKPQLAPTIFYLSEIYNDNQRIAKFYYDRHHPYSNPICSDGSFGRANLLNFNDNWIEYGEGTVSLKTPGKTTTLNFLKNSKEEKFDNLNMFGGNIDYWKPETEEVGLFEPSDLNGYISSSGFLLGASYRLSRGEVIPDVYYKHSFNSDFPKSENHFYFISYLDNLTIKERQESTNEENEFSQKVIKFDYEKIEKKLTLDVSEFNMKNHPILPFIGYHVSSLQDSELTNPTLGQRIVPFTNLIDLIFSSIELRHHRLTQITEPNKVIDIDYYNQHNGSSINELDYYDIVNSPTKSFHFNNNVVKKVEFSSSDNVFNSSIPLTKYTENEYEITLGHDGTTDYINSNNNPTLPISIPKINSKTTTKIYNPESNNVDFKIISNNYYSKLMIDGVAIGNDREFTDYSTLMPVYSKTQYKNINSDFTDYTIENKIGYVSIFDDKPKRTNIVKPYYNESFVSINGGSPIRNSIQFMKYEISDANSDFKETDEEGFDRVIDKVTTYTYKADESISNYSSFYSNLENSNYLKKQIVELDNYKRQDITIQNSIGQFYRNEFAFLERYYDNSFLEDMDNYYNMAELLFSFYDVGGGSLKGNSNFEFDDNGNSKSQKHSQIQEQGFSTSSDEFSLNYYLCYLLTDFKIGNNNDNPYYQDYGNTHATIKPKFGSVKSSKVYTKENGSDILLKGIENILESDAFDGTNTRFTYAQGKPLEQRVLESELYGGNESNYLTTNQIEYSVGAQGGGYPSKVYNANGSLIQNYYVYNQRLHNNVGGRNPVYTVQDYWNPNLKDTDNYPCTLQDYFTPTAYITSSNKKISQDKFIESKYVFQRSKPVGKRSYVRKFKPDNGQIELFDKFPHNNNALTVDESTEPIDDSGSMYVPPSNGKEILSLNNIYEYDDLGRLTAESDPNNQITRYSYDGFGRLKQINRPYDFNQSFFLEQIDRLVIDGVTMTKQRYYDIEYKVDKTNDDECVAKLNDLQKSTIEDRVFSDIFIAGTKNLPLISTPNSCKDLTDEEILEHSSHFSESILTFRLPKSVQSITSLSEAFIELNISDLPEIKERTSQEQEYYGGELNENLILYFNIPQLTDLNGDVFERKIVITPSKYIVDLDPNDNNVDNGFNQKNQRILIELGDYINIDDLKDLMNTEEELQSGPDVKSTKIIINISPFSINDDDDFVDLDKYRGFVRFHDNRSNRALSPKLVLKGQILRNQLRDKDFFMTNEFTVKNYHGNFGDFVNNYVKIDNSPHNGSELDYINFFGNYSKFGYNYNVKQSRTYSNMHSNEDGYYLKKPSSNSENLSINSAERVFNEFDNSLKVTQNIYDEGNNSLGSIVTQNEFGGNGEVVKTELNDGLTFTTEYNYSNGLDLNTQFPDINFYGFAKKVLRIEEGTPHNFADLDVFDMFGNKVLSFVDIEQSSGTQDNWNPDINICSKVIQYHYDLNNQVKRVSEYTGGTNGFRNIYYWYDKFGRMKHSYHPDFGFTHYSYDNVGNVRFKQDQGQFEEDKITYFEYDDLNRVTVTGEAKIDVSLFPGSFDPTVTIDANNFENTTFNTMLDLEDGNGELVLNPNILNDGNISKDDNNNRILTANKTLWQNTYGNNCYLFESIINDTVYNTNSVPLSADIANRILGTNYELPPKGIVHKNYVYNIPGLGILLTSGAAPDEFENLDKNFRYVNRINFYDELPARFGKFAEMMPKEEFISYLSYDHGINGDGDYTLYNTKGRIAVQAYREYENQPFNFIYYSYDARGRIESLIRFTENVGFDCMYYKYNSQDMITHTIAMGPNVSVKTAYVYDGFARLKDVYSEVGDGHGLADLNGTSYLEDLPPSGSLNIQFIDIDLVTDFPDISYTYDSDGKISSKQYNPGLSGIIESYEYESTLRMLEKIDTYNTSVTDPNKQHVFSEMINYDVRNRIDDITTTHKGFGNVSYTNTDDYTYDDIGQLIDLSNNGTSERTYVYDELGNRTSSTDIGGSTTYNYGQDYPNMSRLEEAIQVGNWYNKYTYNDIGQLETRHKAKKHKDGVVDTWKHVKEEFAYNSFNLLQEYEFDYYYGDDDCDLPLDYDNSTKWRYGYNPFDERESKKMIKSHYGDSNGNVYASMYYLLDEKNKQHINYLGVQTSDLLIKSIINDDMDEIELMANMYPSYNWPECLVGNPVAPQPKSEQVMFYPAKLNVYGGNSLAQMSYQYDRATSSWKKYYNIYDHQGSLTQQYKYVNSPWNPPFNWAAVPTLMQVYYPFGEVRWQIDDLTEENKNNQNWIGKEKDNENGLGDHGVRKYEYETGRFTSIEPLWDKYYGWNPYQYSLNSPVMYVDFNGKSESRADFYMDLDNRNLLKGKISKEQFIANHEARLEGALIGISLISPVDELYILNLGLRSTKLGRALLSKVDEISDYFTSFMKSSDEVYDAEKAAEKTVGALTRKINPVLLKDKYLKSKGIDAHALKEEFVGKKRISKFDLFRDKETDEIIIMLKGQKGEPIFTGQYIDG